MRRREFITLLGGGGGVAIAGQGEQPERTRRIGALMNTTAECPSAQAEITAFTQGLQELGWTSGRNVRIDYRWSAADLDLLRKYAAELVALSPDVILILAEAGAAVGALQQASRTVPIVFVSTIDPVGGGRVESLARPGTNATGFEYYQFSIAWLALLREFAPAVKRVVAIRDPSVIAGSAGFAALQTAAASAGMEVIPVGVRNASDIERSIAAFAGAPNSGLIMVGTPYTVFQHREMIVELAARYRLPALYPTRPFAVIDGLISYGPDIIDQYRRASRYIDRILKGAKPADLPVQAPTKYELVINAKTAKALGLAVPATLLISADEVIE